MSKSIIVLLLLLMVVVPASADEYYNFLNQGYGFIEGTEPGDLAGGVGLLEPLQTQNPPFDFDFDNFEVSWVVTGMAVETFSVMGPFESYTFTGGIIGIYEDADFDLDYGVDPATGIATGSDGVPALTGTLSTGSIFYNTSTQIGTFMGICTFDGGSRLVELGDLANGEWEFFNGISGEVDVNVPPGYHTRWAGRITATETVATESSSMSRIRALY